MGPLLRVCLVVVASLFVFTACGEDAPPGERVPALALHVDRVDAAIESGRYADARSAIDDLVTATAQAEVGGELSDDEADRILDAAAELLDELPLDDSKDGVEGSGSPTPSLPSATPPADEDPPDEGEESEGEGSEGEENGSEGDGNGSEGEGNGSEGERGGNGPSSDNGPDDGHGD